MLYPKLPKRQHRPSIGGREVTMGDLRKHVLIRDDRCIAKRLFPTHVCRGRFEDRPYHERDFTLEHVTGVHGHLDGRRDDDEHCVALCYRTNIDHTNAKVREAIRAYLHDLFPECDRD